MLKKIEATGLYKDNKKDYHSKQWEIFKYNIAAA